MSAALSTTLSREGSGRGRGVRSYPVASGLRYVLTDLLGRQTEGTNLGGQGRGGANLTSGGTEVTAFANTTLVTDSLRFGSSKQRRRDEHDLDLIGIELGSCTATA